ncbi:LysR family transcriptional regulator [Lacticaseibacillus songhuajiangensis]|jgi:DNA-binding transcriptional LysR family regulator|uniref:LysR family transcriptional regulator n=1 Tax=Lacticaseibacillus songhuajiangensis TaxID=1296539 RepID=UPI000F79F4D4|nr:LysR family transcriptional regulator [Lacticaseibacillus songhuajiangensis]
MDINKLITFTTLAATGSYTETAGDLFLTQSTVSKHILALEKELDTILFNRSNRQVTLTPAGELLLPHAQQLVGDYRQMLTAVREFKEHKALELNVGTIPTLSHYEGFVLLSKFHALHPEIALHIQEYEAKPLLTALRAGSADVIFLRAFPDENLDLESTASESDSSVIVLPKTHPLAAKEVLTLQNIKDEQLLVLGNSSRLFEPIMRRFTAAGIKPQLAYQGKRIDMIMDMMVSGMGIAIMMQKSVNLDDYPSLVVRQMAQPIMSKVCFARRSSVGNPAMELFWRFLQDQDTPLRP